MRTRRKSWVTPFGIASANPSCLQCPLGVAVKRREPTKGRAASLSQQQLTVALRQPAVTFAYSANFCTRDSTTKKKAVDLQ